MKRMISMLTACLIAATAYAQSVRLQGTVGASDDPFPVTGASVAVKGTSQGTITDLDGNFSLEAKKGDVLVISFVGYKSQEVKVTGAASLNITLEPDAIGLEEVVAIGYGTMKKSDLTGAVTTVKADQLTKTPAAGLDQALQGRAAGVTVNSNSGTPGGAATIRIRGIGSAIGGNDPLYVVDGVITSDISFLSPNDIQSMEILKDASATAIYGSRGANGVILITTKSGGTGKANISFDAYWGIQNRWKKLDLMGAQEMAETKIAIDAMKNGTDGMRAYYLSQVGQTQPFTGSNGFNSWMFLNTGTSIYYPAILGSYAEFGSHAIDGFDYSSVDTDWQDEVFRKNAFMHSYNLSIDGGSDKGHYSFSASYFDQDGTLKGSDYKRLTLRFNSDYAVRSWLKIGEHLSFMTNSSHNDASNNNANAGVLSQSLRMAPWDPTHYPEGTRNVYGEDLSGQIAASSNFKNVYNPFSIIEMAHPNNTADRWVGDVWLEIEPIKDLKLKSSLSIDNSLNRSRLFKESYEYSSYDKSDKNYVSSSISRYNTLLEETTLTYSKSIGQHSFSLMGGQTWSEYNYYNIGGAGSSILNTAEENWYLNQATEDRTESSDAVSRQRRLSWLGRLYYSYASRYMITVNFRADGSSKFANNPWGFFPSAALAWRVSEEPFLKNLELSWLDNLKVRAGWGRVGNDGIPNGSFVVSMHQDKYSFTGYPLGVDQALVTGATITTYANTEGKWETNEQWDAGLDFGFWNGKLSGSIDYFLRDTKDALLYVNAPAHAGSQFSMVNNVGVIRNQGIELTLNHENQVGKVHYSVGGNLSWIKNELTEVNGGSPLYEDRTKSYLGMPLKAFWGYEYEGVYQSDDEALAQLYSYDASTIGVHAGDARYKDRNGDGKIDDEDKTQIGNPFPKLTYGLNLGAEFYGFDVQLFFQGVAGMDVYNALRTWTEGAGDEMTLSKDMRNVWIGYSEGVRSGIDSRLGGIGYSYSDFERRNGTIPNPVGAPTNTENSSRFIEDASYLRLKNLQIGYTLPKNITQKAYIDRCRFYISASNLFTLTKYSGYDPEVGSGVDYGNYPQSRTFTFGVNLDF
ncbi:MAG: TonB-dependent receptor [Paludibacteraceae bacterium]|nr:TonB-dependent receptor [Paludibacteraceae bacterium]